MVELSSEEREKIAIQAKQILDDFSKALASVSISLKTSALHLGGFRTEGAGMSPDVDFRDRMFANATRKNKDAIIAEKKSW